MSARPELIDIGANLTHESFAHDLGEVVKQAQAVGISHIIVTGTDLASSRAAIELTRQFSMMSATAGFHPHVASECNAKSFAAISDLLKDPAVVAVGETGLDFNRNYSPPELQEQSFIRHLELAADIKKPLFLHQRDAHEKFLQLLRHYRANITAGVVHCFTDSQRALKEYLELDMYIGITGWICDERRGQLLQEIVKDIPPDRLLLETDAPYLLPRSLKPRPQSRRNEPRHLATILDTVASCTGRSAAELSSETSANARRLFQL